MTTIRVTRLPQPLAEFVRNCLRVLRAGDFYRAMGVTSRGSPPWERCGECWGSGCFTCEFRGYVLPERYKREINDDE